MDSIRFLAVIFQGFESGVSLLSTKSNMSYFPPITNKKPPRKSSNQEDAVGISSRMTRLEEENAILRAEIQRSSEERRSLQKAVRALSSKLRNDLKTLRDEHRVANQDMCKRTSSLEKNVSRHETRLDRESVTSIVESKLVRPVVRSFEMEERANRVLKSCQETCVREIETRIKQVRKTILREVEDMEKNKEKYWHDELIHAQAFLDGLPLPVRPPPVEDSSLKSAVEDSLKCAGPVVSVENIFPDDGS